MITGELVLSRVDRLVLAIQCKGHSSSGIEHVLLFGVEQQPLMCEREPLLGSLKIGNHFEFVARSRFRSVINFLIIKWLSNRHVMTEFVMRIRFAFLPV